jgi:hypothetical protein
VRFTALQLLQRLVWCPNNQNRNFEIRIFCDEANVRAAEIPLYHWRLKNGYPEKYGCAEKYRMKVNVWGAISFRGATEFKVEFYSTICATVSCLRLIYFYYRHL